MTFKTPPVNQLHKTIQPRARRIFSDGFKINELPHAIEIGYIHIGTIAGKLKGVMPVQP